MKHRYRVHRTSPHPFETEATLPGTDETVKATVHSVEVELVPHGHVGGTMLRRFIGKEAEEAAKKYHDGDVVEIDEDAFVVIAPEKTGAAA